MNKAVSEQVYLDQAATTFPKPPEVIRAVQSFMMHRGGNPGRGSHALALAAAKEIYACREEAAALFGFSHPERVIFTVNTTQALNMVIKGLLRQGDHVLCSDMEHNSVLRPLWKLRQAGVIDYSVFDTFPAAPVRTTDMILAAIRRAVTPRTRMLICAHASNICSASLPLAAIGNLCRERGIIFVVDGAQSAGALDIHMEEMHIDALCVPGHKGLMGPQGAGMLLLGEHIHPDTLMEGGNGVDSLEGGMSDESPERYEAGTLPAPAIAGLRAGLAFVRRTGLEAIRNREHALCAQVRDALMEMPHVTVYAPEHEGAVLLFSVKGMASEEVGTYLDGKGICVRPGFHCSALGHNTLSTPASGAVRASFGYFNTSREGDALISAIKAIRVHIH